MSSNDTASCGATQLTDFEDTEIARFVASTTGNVGLAVVLLVAFTVLRAVRLGNGTLHLRRFFAPRSFLTHVRAPRYGRLLPWALLWWWRALAYPLEDILRHHSADSAMHVAFLQVAVVVFASLALVGCVFLLPTYVLGGLWVGAVDVDLVSGSGGLSLLTMHHVTGDRMLLMFAPWFATLLFGGVVVICVWALQRYYVLLRKRWHHARSARNYTLMVDEFPDELLDEAQMRRFFQLHYGHAPVAVSYSYGAFFFRRKVHRYDAIMEQLAEARARQRSCDEDYRARVRREAQKRDARAIAEGSGFALADDGGVGGEAAPPVQMRTGPLGWVGRKVDAIPYLQARLDGLREEITRVRADPDAHLRRTRVAFVTFDSMFLPRTRTQPFEDSPYRMQLLPAPEYRDVFWSNLSVVHWSRVLRWIVVAILLLFLTAIWASLLIAIVSLFQLSALLNLSDLGGLSALSTSYVWVNAIVQGYLPPLLVVIAQVLFYYLCQTLIRYFVGIHSRSEAERIIMVFYYLFLFTNVFIVSAIGTSLLQYFARKLEDITLRCVVAALASSIPVQSNYFLGYVVALTFFTLPRKLFRFLDLVMWFVRMPFARSDQRKERLMRGVHLDPTADITEDLFVFSLCLIYSVYAPLISVFGLVYFMLELVIQRYLVVYVRESYYESGGAYWPVLYHGMMFTVVFFFLVMAALIGMRSDGFGTVLTIFAVIVVTLWVYIARTSGHMSIYGSIVGIREFRAPTADEFRDSYQQPVLRERPFNIYYLDDYETLEATDAEDGITSGNESLRLLPPPLQN
jgi:hypothetical protein